ncbi:MAG: 4a-hydroxytetrahydrobiopterin dehydratase [Chloroflexi bacterium]|nr:4a-hydroxytetrahydrobiopterin dehydratase [Chloroflexota bacterium]
MTPLKDERCVPCTGGIPPLSEQAIQSYLPEVPDWNRLDEHGVAKIQRTFRFPKYLQALTFAQQVGMLAEDEGHHPVMLVEWGSVTVTWWTHKIKGLHRNDFIMAAKTDQLYAQIAAV